MLSRRQVITGAAGVAAGSMAGCTTAASAGPTARWAQPGTSLPSSDSPSPVSTATVAFSPAADATAVSPTDPVVVTASGGTLTSVTVSAGGAAVAGRLDADQRTWRSTGALAYGKTYTVTASVADGSGVTGQQSATFTTIKPAGTTGVTFQANALNVLKDGGTYGVGQIVVVAFSKKITDRAAAEKAVVVQATPDVPGKFFWLDNQTLHYRPEKYWASGTKIAVRVKLFGVHLGGGIYGAGDASTSFSIGDSRVAVVDAQTHRMQVFLNGQQIKDFPISCGKGGTTTAADGSTIDFNTRSGPHVVLEKDQTVHMSSASYGITDPKDKNYYAEDISLCVRISYSGEYCHAAGWNIPDHGRRNVSHGCVNMNPADAQWVFTNFNVGDVVEVRNTPVQLPVWDGLGDWNVAWSQYGH